jgi:hypothetical protein
LAVAEITSGGNKHLYYRASNGRLTRVIHNGSTWSSDYQFTGAATVDEASSIALVPYENTMHIYYYSEGFITNVEDTPT